MPLLPPSFRRPVAPALRRPVAPALRRPLAPPLRRPVAPALALALGLAGPACQTQAPARPAPARAAAACPSQAEVLEAAALAFERSYIRPEGAAIAAGALRGARRDGRYGRLCGDAPAFARALTDDLRRATGDGHVQFEHVGAGAAPGEDGWIAAWLGRGPAVNWGVGEARVLEGGVGYLKIASFYPVKNAAGALAGALRAVAGAGALVLDLRGNGGGEDSGANALLSALFDDDRVLLAYRDRARVTREDRAAHVLAAPRFGGGRPIAVLIDRRSFSAAEAVAYVLQAEGRARVFGAPTGGGAHMTTEERELPGGFRVGLPDLMPVQPRTGANWEGKGVTPDVATAAEDALPRALEWARAAAPAP